MRVVGLVGVLGLALAMLQCSGRDGETVEGRGRQDTVRSAQCVAQWSPTFRQGSGANLWWVEYEVGGGDVASVLLEVPGSGAVALSPHHGKWGAGSPFEIPVGTEVFLYATNAAGGRAQSLPFSYLVEREPVADPCRDDVDRCNDTATFAQASGANEWWVELSLSEPARRVHLDLPSGTSLELAHAYGKWRGRPGARIPAGTEVVARAEGITWWVATTEPFAYLVERTPPTTRCTASPDACAFAPTFREGIGANEWWVEYVISGAIASAHVEVVGGQTVTLARGSDKWRGAPSARIPSGTTVVVHAESATGDVAETEPFRYLEERTPTRRPCATP